MLFSGCWVGILNFVVKAKAKGYWIAFGLSISLIKNLLCTLDSSICKPLYTMCQEHNLS